MDKLDTLFTMQKALNEDIIKRRGLHGISPEEWIQKHMLAMLSEMGELLDEVNFKWWKNEKPIHPDNLKEEVVDILHFFLSICINAGMDGEELFRRYLKKNEENYRRQAGKSEKPGYGAGQ